MIKSVYVFPNGMVAVFDYKGNQISKYQGKWSKMEVVIRKNADKNTKFNYQNNKR